ncbi:unnamed protein product [Rhizopus stolonifer]
MAGSQYKEIEIIRPNHELYGGTIGSVFSHDQLKQEISDLKLDSEAYSQILDMEQKLPRLILTEYRYIRLVFHPILSKFLIVG